MQTTVDIDQAKLHRVMEMNELNSPDKAIDLALDQAERTAKRKALLAKPFYVHTIGDMIDPDYDLMKMRNMERPAG